MRDKSFCPYCASPLVRKAIEGLDRLYCDRCRAPLYENPVPAACIVVADDRSRILLVKRGVSPKIGWWCLPGGFLEIGESPEDGALRELEEETALAGKIDRLLGATVGPSEAYGAVLVVGYSVRNFTGSPRAKDDALDVAWFSHEDLPELAFESHARFVRIYRALSNGQE
jgi:8-oxo-dGTP diphosphatase